MVDTTPNPSEYTINYKGSGIYLKTTDQELANLSYEYARGRRSLTVQAYDPTTRTFGNLTLDQLANITYAKQVLAQQQETAKTNLLAGAAVASTQPRITELTPSSTPIEQKQFQITTPIGVTAEGKTIYGIQGSGIYSEQEAITKLGIEPTRGVYVNTTYAPKDVIVTTPEGKTTTTTIYEPSRPASSPSEEMQRKAQEEAAAKQAVYEQQVAAQKQEFQKMLAAGEVTTETKGLTPVAEYIKSQGIQAATPESIGLIRGTAGTYYKAMLPPGADITSPERVLVQVLGVRDGKFVTEAPKGSMIESFGGKIVSEVPQLATFQKVGAIGGIEKVTAPDISKGERIYGYEQKFYYPGQEAEYKAEVKRIEAATKKPDLSGAFLSGALIPTESTLNIPISKQEMSYGGSAGAIARGAVIAEDNRTEFERMIEMAPIREEKILERSRAQVESEQKAAKVVSDFISPITTGIPKTISFGNTIVESFAKGGIHAMTGGLDVVLPQVAAMPLAGYHLVSDPEAFLEAYKKAPLVAERAYEAAKEKPYETIAEIAGSLAVGYAAGKILGYKSIKGIEQESKQAELTYTQAPSSPIKIVEDKLTLSQKDIGVEYGKKGFLYVPKEDELITHTLLESQKRTQRILTFTDKGKSIITDEFNLIYDISPEAFSTGTPTILPPTSELANLKSTTIVGFKGTIGAGEIKVGFPESQFKAGGTFDYVSSLEGSGKVASSVSITKQESALFGEKGTGLFGTGLLGKKTVTIQKEYLTNIPTSEETSFEFKTYDVSSPSAAKGKYTIGEAKQMLKLTPEETKTPTVVEQWTYTGSEITQRPTRLYQIDTKKLPEGKGVTPILVKTPVKTGEISGGFEVVNPFAEEIKKWKPPVQYTTPQLPPSQPPEFKFGEDTIIYDTSTGTMKTVISTKGVTSLFYKPAGIAAASDVVNLLKTSATEKAVSLGTKAAILGVGATFVEKAIEKPVSEMKTYESAALIAEAEQKPAFIEKAALKITESPMQQKYIEPAAIQIERLPAIERVVQPQYTEIYKQPYATPAIPSYTPSAIEKQIIEPIEEPIITPGEKPVITPIEKPTEIPVEKPVEKPIIVPVEKPIIVPVEKPAIPPYERPTPPYEGVPKGFEGGIIGGITLFPWSPEEFGTPSRGKKHKKVRKKAPSLAAIEFPEIFGKGKYPKVPTGAEIRPLKRGVKMPVIVDKRMINRDAFGAGAERYTNVQDRMNITNMEKAISKSKPRTKKQPSIKEIEKRISRLNKMEKFKYKRSKWV